MSTANRVIKNTGFLYAKMGITMFISLYTTRLILNSLGASDFGIFNIVGGAISMLGFLNAAMASATQRFMSYSEGEGNREKQKSIFNVSFILHLGISIVVGISLLIAGYFFFNGILNIPQNRIFAAQVIYGSLIISTMFTVMTVPYDAAMNAHENMKYYAIIGIIESTLKLAVAFICVYTNHDKLIIYGILMAIIPIITLTIMRFYCHKYYKECIILPRKYWNKALMKEMTSFAGWNFISSSTNMIGNYGLGIVLNIFFTTIVNAAQGIANQLNGLLISFANNMLKAVNPIIIKSKGANQQELFIKTIVTGCKLNFYLTAIFMLPAIIEMPFILKIWLKEVPEYAVIFSQLQLLRTMIEQITLLVSSSVAANGQIKQLSIASSIINLFPLPLIYLSFYYGAPPQSMYIISIFIWSIIGCLPRLYFSHKLNGIQWNIYTNKIILPCILSFIVGLIFGYIPNFLHIETSYVRLFFTIILCDTTFMAIAILFLSKDEKRICLSILTLTTDSIKNKLRKCIKSQKKIYDKK